MTQYIISLNFELSKKEFTLPPYNVTGYHDEVCESERKRLNLSLTDH